MIQIEWTDKELSERTIRVDSVKLWESRGGREHPAGTVIEGWRNGEGVIQLDVDDRVGTVYIREVD